MRNQKICETWKLNGTVVVSFSFNNNNNHRKKNFFYVKLVSNGRIPKNNINKLLITMLALINFLIWSNIYLNY